MVTIFIKITAFVIVCIYSENTSVECDEKINKTEEKPFDFRDVVKENNLYAPLIDHCPLRIYGGRAYDIKDVPYQTVIRINARNYWRLICGGVIVTPKHVLSAAHCFEEVFKFPLDRFRVVAGTSYSELDLSRHHKDQQQLQKTWETTEVWRVIEQCYVHESYCPITNVHDLAVLVLHIPYSFMETIQPIPMIKPDMKINVEYGSKQISGLGLVSGYGLMENNVPSPTLRVVCVPFVARWLCGNYYIHRITNSQICAGSWNKDSCIGDSGGPLTYKGMLVGLVSYGGICGKAPGVYTLISSYTNGEEVRFVKAKSVKIACDFILIVVELLVIYSKLNIIFLCTKVLK